jgi:UTP--glucose-1-phosphate uridylyltransferase
MQHGIDERAGMNARSRMDHHARGLVDRDHRCVLVQDVERQVLGFRAQRRQLGGIYVDRFRTSQQVRAFGRRAIHADAAGFDPLLQARAAEFGQSLVEIAIQSLAGISRRGSEMDHRNTTSYIQEVIRRAIVPVAGAGTRMMPATKSQPKEMLPVARKPIVHYVAEELIGNNIDQILFVTGRNKTSIENHFDTDPELVRTLSASNKKELLEAIGFDGNQAHFFYTRQRVQNGLGDAILCGESFAGEQPFVVALGDSILGLHAQSKTVLRMAEIFESRHASCVVAVEEVPPEQTVNYGVVKIKENDGDAFRVIDLVEKPKPGQAPSNLAIAGRYIFSPLIFDMIRRVKPDARGEIQLTSAMAQMCEEGKRVLAVKLPANERRYDIGNFPSYFETFVEFALADPLYGDALRLKIEQLLEKSQSAGKD